MKKFHAQDSNKNIWYVKLASFIPRFTLINKSAVISGINEFNKFNLSHITIDTLDISSSSIAVSPGRDDSLQKAQGNLPIRSAR
ncbi:hypothetical protein BMR06_13500 [Methylococcaceae bacterium HT5]|nr:hypothetical protein BMR06_13500 [Methylococcaceae bacterium HT5]